MTGRLADKVVVVTGAAGILGRRYTAALLEAGARVVALDRNPGALAELAGTHPDVQVIETDIGAPASVSSALAETLQVQDRVDVLINNAATKSEHFFEPFATFPLEDWQAVFRVNVEGAMLCAQSFGGHMAAAGHGSIVNILSIYGIVAPDQRIYEGSEYEGRPINTPAVYSASKAALWGLTQYLAAYWGGVGVRVNAITPGGMFSGQNDTFVARYSARVPMGRMGQPDELCGALLYLASDESSYVTGQNLVVDGGLTCW